MHLPLRAAMAAATVALCGAACAQSRVIEETLILKDPTVAAQGQSIFGASAEALYINAPFKSFSTSDDGSLEEGRANATSYGGNVFAGYGDFTMAGGIEYSVHLAESPSATVDSLVAQPCAEPGGDAYLGSWLLIYKQP